MNQHEILSRVLAAVARYERWHMPNAPAEPCDFCHNTTEHMPDCPVTLAKQLLQDESVVEPLQERMEREK